MKTTLLIQSAVLVLLAARPAFGQADPAPEADRCGAPRFEITGDEKNAEKFPLKSTEVRGSIAGVIADVTVEQTYANTGEDPIEAVYIFPASTRAAVHGVEMRIGERIIKAKIEEKEQAKKIYEQAKQQHKTASLLEQERPNVFRMSVANILPGDEVKEKLRKVKQPLPLPKGVSQNALGSGQVSVGVSGGSSAGGAAPEPGTLGLLAMVGVALLLHRHRSKD